MSSICEARPPTENPDAISKLELWREICVFTPVNIRYMPINLTMQRCHKILWIVNSAQRAIDTVSYVRLCVVRLFFGQLASMELIIALIKALRLIMKPGATDEVCYLCAHVFCTTRRRTNNVWKFAVHFQTLTKLLFLQPPFFVVHCTLTSSTHLVRHRLEGL